MTLFSDTEAGISTSPPLMSDSSPAPPSPTFLDNVLAPVAVQPSLVHDGLQHGARASSIAIPQMDSVLGSKWPRAREPYQSARDRNKMGGRSVEKWEPEP